MSTFFDRLEDDWRDRADDLEEAWPAAREQREMFVRGRALDDELLAETSRKGGSNQPASPPVSSGEAGNSSKEAA